MKLKKINEEHYELDSVKVTDRLSEVKELLGEVDVEKKAKEWLSSKGFKETSIAYTPFVSGYNQALEDNKEKKYTEEDMRKAIEFGHTSCTPFADVHYSNFIQSLQHNTEWEVDIINGKLTIL